MESKLRVDIYTYVRYIISVISVIEMSPTLGKRRKTLNKTQKLILMKKFNSWTNKRLRDEEICQFALSFNISEKIIENWCRYTREKKRAQKQFSQREYNVQY